MPELDNALTVLAAWLDREQIPYMVIGGFAVTVWGEPRFTRDLDVTVSVPPERLHRTIEQMCSEFTPLVADPQKFVTETRVLPLMVSAVPVDMVFAVLPYEEAAIARAQKLDLKNGSVRICSPEDLILHKIVSRRARDHEDIEGVFRYRHAELDYAYLDPRVEELADALADRNMLEWYRALRKRWEPRA
jgi:Nucleotidyltransferase of unknown function (DUF6036)